MTGDRLLRDVAAAADGDELAFVRVCRDRRVVDLVGKLSGKFYAPGLARDDFAQEARIALWAAVRRWDGRYAVDGFLGFTAMVVDRQMRTVLRRALREKHKVLGSAFDLYSPAHVDSDVTLAQALPGGVDPLELLIVREELAAVVAAAGRLSALERRALGMVLSGVSYTGDKRVDNAVQRARAKLRVAWRAAA